MTDTRAWLVQRAGRIGDSAIRHSAATRDGLINEAANRGRLV